MPPIHLISRTIFHLEVCGARGALVIPKWLSAAFWPILFLMDGLRPSVLQVVAFSDPSFVFAPVWAGHNTIFCPFRFKIQVCGFSFIVGRLFSRFLTFCFLTLFTLYCNLRHSVPVFIARHLAFVFCEVHTFRYCFAPHGLTWRFLYAF